MSDIVEDIQTKLRAFNEGERKMRLALADALKDAWHVVLRSSLPTEPEGGKRYRFATAQAMVFAVNMSLENVATFWHHEYKFMVNEIVDFTTTNPEMLDWLLGRESAPN